MSTIERLEQLTLLLMSNPRAMDERDMRTLRGVKAVMKTIAMLLDRMEEEENRDVPRLEVIRDISKDVHMLGFVATAMLAKLVTPSSTGLRQ